MSNSLDDARKIINAADREMAELFVRRMQAAAEIAEYKKIHGLPVTDPEREREVVAKNSGYIADSVLREYYVTFINDVMSVSRAYQTRLLNGMKIRLQRNRGRVCPYRGGKDIFIRKTGRLRQLPRRI